VESHKLLAAKITSVYRTTKHNVVLTCQFGLSAYLSEYLDSPAAPFREGRDNNSMCKVLRTVSGVNHYLNSNQTKNLALTIRPIFMFWRISIAISY